MFVCIYAGERQDAAKFVWGGRVEMVKQLLMASRLSECQWSVRFFCIAELCPPLPLGMQSKQIQDCQISGSNSPTPNWQPQNARPGSATGMCLRQFQISSFLYITFHMVS